jgi:hypothetical protein
MATVARGVPILEDEKYFARYVYAYDVDGNRFERTKDNRDTFFETEEEAIEHIKDFVNSGAEEQVKYRQSNPYEEPGNGASDAMKGIAMFYIFGIVVFVFGVYTFFSKNTARDCRKNRAFYQPITLGGIVSKIV